MGVITATFPLFGVIALGALAGAVRLFPKPDAAIGILNRFTLYIAFPLLIVGSLADSGFDLPDSSAFYLFHLLAVALLVPIARGLGRGDRVVVAGAMFGNIAYLGIPYCAAVLGPESVGLASLSAALHILICMSLAPALLARAAAGAHETSLHTARRVLRQPLVWAPLIGLTLRAVAPAPRMFVVETIAPVGAAAGPVALFMIGLYLWQRRHLVGEAGRGVLVVLGAKLVVYPALMAALILGLQPWLPVTAIQRGVLILVSAMPVAVTTFSLAEEFGAGQDVLSVSIVLSTLASLLTLSVLSVVVV